MPDLFPPHPHPQPTDPLGSDPTDDPAPPGRPLLPPTVGQRYDDLRSRVDVGRARVIATLAGVLVAGAFGWWLLRPPAPAVEQSLPMASAAGTGPSGTGAATGAASSTGGSTPPGTDGTAPAELVVHAAGAVARPGVYRLPAGARVDDLINAAGGLRTDGDPGRLNLAAPLQDGERVYVPILGQAEVPVAVGETPAGSAATAGPAASPGSPGTAAAAPVDLNTATLEQLDTLPGVGPSTAQAILDHRQEHGRFTSVDELLDVRGIGDAKMAQLRSRVTV